MGRHLDGLNRLRVLPPTGRLKAKMWPLFVLKTGDGSIQLTEEDAANKEYCDLIFDIAFKLLELTRKRIEEAEGL